MMGYCTGDMPKYFSGHRNIFPSPSGLEICFQPEIFCHITDTVDIPTTEFFLYLTFEKCFLYFQ